MFARNDCTLAWDYSLEDEQRIDGFQFEVNGVRTTKLSRKLRRAPCSRVGIVKGDYSIKLYAFKGEEYSGPSNSVTTTVEPFVPRERGVVPSVEITTPVLHCVP